MKEFIFTIIYITFWLNCGTSNNEISNKSSSSENIYQRILKKRNYDTPSDKNNSFKIKKKQGNINVTQYFEKEKDIYLITEHLEVLNVGKPKTLLVFYYPSGYIKEKFQVVQHESFVYESANADEPSKKMRNSRFGKLIVFDPDNRISKISCYIPDNHNGTLCGTETHYFPDGRIKKTINHPAKCTMGCGEFTPYLDEGSYYKVEANEIKVHKEPDVKSEVLFTLKKGEFFKILEDTQKIVDIGENTAPWGKIGYGEGYSSTGYVFGSSSFLSGPYE